jgi:hypothetical protein
VAVQYADILIRDRINGAPGTLIDAADKNQMQEEIVRAIEDSGLNPDSNDVEQLAKAIHRIARLESSAASVFPIEAELLSSPQNIDLRSYGISDENHNYLAVTQVQGVNENDVACSYEFNSDDRLILMIYSRYSDSSGNRVAGLPYQLTYTPLGSELGLPLSGTSSGVVIKLNIFLRQFEEI